MHLIQIQSQHARILKVVDFAKCFHHDIPMHDIDIPIYDNATTTVSVIQLNQLNYRYSVHLFFFTHSFNVCLIIDKIYVTTLSRINHKNFLPS
jgi:hypothetical protein